MNFVEQVVARLAPHTCVVCGFEGDLLCPACVADLPKAVERCYRCQKKSDAGKTCQSCQRHTKLTDVRALTRYEGAAKDLVWKLKFTRAKAAGEEIGCMLAPLITNRQDHTLVHIPTATSRVRQRGYDQANLIAHASARAAKLPHQTALVRSGQWRQVGGNRQLRLQQMASAFSVRNPEAVRGQHIVLIDDVVTTGATLEAAAAVLKNAGAKSIEAVVFAQA